MSLLLDLQLVPDRILWAVKDRILANRDAMEKRRQRERILAEGRDGATGGRLPLSSGSGEGYSQPPGHRPIGRRGGARQGRYVRPEPFVPAYGGSSASVHWMVHTRHPFSQQQPEAWRITSPSGASANVVHGNPAAPTSPLSGVMIQSHVAERPDLTVDAGTISAMSFPMGQTEWRTLVLPAGGSAAIYARVAQTTSGVIYATSYTFVPGSQAEIRNNYYYVNDWGLVYNRIETVQCYLVTPSSVRSVDTPNALKTYMAGRMPWQAALSVNQLGSPRRMSDPRWIWWNAESVITDSNTVKPGFTYNPGGLNVPEESLPTNSGYPEYVPAYLYTPGVFAAIGDPAIPVPSGGGDFEYPPTQPYPPGGIMPSFRYVETLWYTDGGLPGQCYASLRALGFSDADLTP